MPLLFTSVPPPSPPCQIDFCLPPIGTLVIMLKVQPDNPGWPSLLKMFTLITSKVHPGGLSWWTSGWDFIFQCGRCRFDQPGQTAKIPHVSQLTKTWNRNSIVAYSIKTFKNGPHKKKIFKILLKKKKVHPRPSLVVQWLRLWSPNAGGLGSIPGWGPRSHILQLRACMPWLRSGAAK